MSEDVRSAAERLLKAWLDKHSYDRMSEEDTREELLRCSFNPEFAALAAAAPRIVQGLLALLASLVRGEGQKEHHANCEVTVATCTCEKEKDLSRGRTGS